MRKLFDQIKAVQSLRPQAATATANGTGIDTKGYGDAMVVLEVGTVTGTTPTLDVKIQESDDNTTFTDTGITFSQVTASNSSQVKRVAELNVARKRYIRAVATIAGTSPNFALSVEVLLGNAASLPVNDD